MDTETEFLIDKCKLGDSEAFHKLFARYQEKTLRIVRLRLDSRTRNLLKIQSMDILQEVFIAAFKKIQDYRPMTKGSFIHWLSKIIENNIKDHIDYNLADKRKAIDGEESLDEIKEFDSGGGLNLNDILPNMNTSPTQHIFKRNIRSVIDNILLKLDEPEREIIIQHKLEELTFREIAEIIGKTEDAVRKQYSRAFKKLMSLAEGDQTLKELR